MYNTYTALVLRDEKGKSHKECASKKGWLCCMKVKFCPRFAKFIRQFNHLFCIINIFLKHTGITDETVIIFQDKVCRNNWVVHTTDDAITSHHRWYNLLKRLLSSRCSLQYFCCAWPYIGYSLCVFLKWWSYHLCKLCLQN